jgi:hypothetical protein
MLKTLGAGLIAASALPAMLASAGIASADDYAGKKYSDVMSALGDAGLTGVIATRTGDLVDDDDCMVTHSEKAPWLKGDDFSPVTDTVLLFLDCDAGVASAKASGNSKASPEGRAAMAEAKKEAQQEQQQAAADQAKAKH